MGIIWELSDFICSGHGWLSGGAREIFPVRVMVAALRAGLTIVAQSRSFSVSLTLARQEPRILVARHILAHRKETGLLTGGLMFGGKLGMPELLLILGVALLVFGPKKLGELGKGLGEGIRNFKSSMSEGANPPPSSPEEKKQA